MIIADHTKKDGSQMKSISLLGMVFLPGTFLAVSYNTLRFLHSDIFGPQIERFKSFRSS